MAERKKHKPDPEAVRPANDSVGETLRAARQTKGLDIDAVSHAIHIRSAQIKAIEENNIESLPGMTYAVGFVRSYANYLGLNGAEIVHRFKAEHGHSAPARDKLSFPEPIAESRVPDPMMVGVGAFLAVVILVLWTIYSNVHGGNKTADTKVPPAPVVTSVADSLPSGAIAGATTTPAPAPATPAAPGAPATTDATATAATPATATPAAPAPVPAATAATQPAAPAGTPAEPQPAATAAATPAAPAAQPAQTATAKTADASDDSEDDNDDDTSAKSNDNDEGVIQIKHKSRITLKATEASWVQVSDAHENVLYRKVLRPGEQYSVPDQPGLHLDTANAGGLEVIVDGHRAPALGKDGDIMRGIPLNPQELR